ncbi:MAG: NAD(P)H-hydrate epimerase [Candidatus Aenigmatarchaeota archaeon]
MIPIITKEQMTKIDELAVKHFGIEIMQMMEIAGKNTAEMARKMLKRVKGKEIVCLAGKGNNGGDALVAAKYLTNWGAKVTVINVNHPDEMNQLTKEQNGILRSMHVSLLYTTNVMAFEKIFKTTDLIIDGLLGYSVNGNPRGFYGKVIEMANHVNKKILSIDIPSGLDPNTGEAYEPCIKASVTLCLTLPKKGCVENKKFAGDIYVADMGIPNEVYELMGLHVGPIFQEKDIIKL